MPEEKSMIRLTNYCVSRVLSVILMRAGLADDFAYPRAGTFQKGHGLHEGHDARGWDPRW